MKARPLLPLLSLSLLPGVAFAHAGHAEHGLMAGLMHPLTGLDHLLAMLAIGIWAALQSRTLKFAVPASFLGLLLAGFALGVAGIALPLVETGIALSVLVLGLLIASAARLPAPVSLVIAGGFALFHGHAHGMEASGGILAFAVGFLLASLALHLAGAVLANALNQRVPMIARLVGGAIAASGALMLV